MQQSMLLFCLTVTLQASSHVSAEDLAMCERNSNLLEQFNRNYDPVPTVFVAILARNKESSLPYFLSYFQNLRYPKNKMFLYIRADHCEDKTIDILEDWLQIYKSAYREVDAILDRSKTSYESQIDFPIITEEIMENVVKHKEEALEKSKKLLADYTLFLDADVYLTNKNVLAHLIAMNHSISAPLLISLESHSNFWGGMSSSYWYERPEIYEEILRRKQIGCFTVPLVNSFILINMWSSSVDMLSFNATKLPVKNVPNDDLIAFAVSVSSANLTNALCNSELYGYLDYILDDGETLLDSYKYLQDLKSLISRYDDPLKTTAYLSKYVPPQHIDTAGLDRIYYINLDRRKDKKKYMEQALFEAGLEAIRIPAVDGEKLNLTQLEMKGISVLDGYADPSTGREMTMGEIGCFLSHYKIWEKILLKGYEQVMILEDDVFFSSNFKNRLTDLIQNLKETHTEWDFVYLGRKRLNYDYDEPQVDGIDNLVHPTYSYWLIGYLLSFSGAQKLVQARPLKNMIPTDEYIPLMFDDNNSFDWLDEEFPRRDLKAFALEPESLEPRLFLTDALYISDTEGIDKTLPVIEI